MFAVLERHEEIKNLCSSAEQVRTLKPAVASGGPTMTGVPGNATHVAFCLMTVIAGQTCALFVPCMMINMFDERSCMMVMGGMH